MERKGGIEGGEVEAEQQEGNVRGEKQEDENGEGGIRDYASGGGRKCGETKQESKSVVDE